MLLFLLGVAWTACHGAAPIHLVLTGGVPVIQAEAQPGERLIAEHSINLQDWNETARVFGRLKPYPDAAAHGNSSGFYRVRRAPEEPADDWSNQLDVPSGRLFRPGTGGGLAGIGYAKWTLLLARPDRVHFQDTVAYPFHYPFARARLPGYAGMGVLDFNAQSLYANPAQRMVLGSVLRAPDPAVRELAIDVTGAEAFPAARTVEWVDTVRRRLAVEPGWRVFYLPSIEQRAEAEENRGLFEARGLEIIQANRWVTANTCYSPGWALGRLVWVPRDQIGAALGDGRLGLADVLVTDGIPAELPVLAGYLTFEPATPNSHVALLARSLQRPFAHVHGAGTQAELLSLLGREVLLVVAETNGVCRVTTEDTTGRLTETRRREILDLQRGGALDLVPKTARGALTVAVDPLTPADLRYVGGKAAHFGILRRSLPDTTPSPVLAIPFDLWDAYLAQPFPGGPTLQAFIASRLARHRYPPRIADLRADLAAIRTAVEDQTDFTPAQRATLVDALQAAGLRGARIRFRSSTNVEDGESFSGAGLYDSFSGCLEDDTDADTRGPSHCDPGEPKERGVFRALRKVFASFYNENAVLERLRHQVDESTVGMAVLVHFSVPDEQEMANGVATLAVEHDQGVRTVSVRVVSQLGAESVTNPDGTARPEVVTARYAGDDASAAELVLQETSSRATPGASVLHWPTDYRTLLDQLESATRAYHAHDPARRSYELDFEYKKLLPGTVGLKQMRPVPRPVPVPPPTIP
jgi:hypothetical protein